jgi:hypothetical protein
MGTERNSYFSQVVRKDRSPGGDRSSAGQGNPTQGIWRMDTKGPSLDSQAPLGQQQELHQQQSRG